MEVPPGGMYSLKCCKQKAAINASRAMRNDFIQPKFLFKSNALMQPYLSNYTIARVVQLKTIVLYCRRNARFPVHTSPPRKFSACAARFLIRPGPTPDHHRPSPLSSVIPRGEQVQSLKHADVFL